MILIELFHGRTHLKQELNDWGEQGPIFIADWLHVTYLSHIRFGTHDHSKSGEGELGVVDDMLYYDGMFYGDWSVFSPTLEQFDAMKDRIVRYKECRAEIPERYWKKTQSPKLPKGQKNETR